MASANPMAAMVALQMAQHPQGPNIGGPMSMGPGVGSGGMGPEGAAGGGVTPPMGQQSQLPPDLMAQLAQAAQGPSAGNPQAGAALVAAIQKLLPKLKLAEHHNGVFELHGPAQDQFLGGVYARAKGARLHSVHNTGKGQRLHVAMP